MFDIKNAEIPDYQDILGQHTKATSFATAMKDYSLGLATGAEVPE